MYKNIGAKCTRLATVCCVFGIIASVIGGIGLIASNMIPADILTIIIGSLFSWVSSFVLYAIGDTNTKVTWLAKNKGWRDDGVLQNGLKATDSMINEARKRQGLS